MDLQNIFIEMKRRRIYSVAAAYVVAGWLLIQIATQVFPFFAIPDWIVRFIVLLLIVGFPVVVVGTWAFEQPSNTSPADNEVGRKNVRATGRKLTALVLLLATVAAGLMVFRFVRSQEKSTPTPVARSASKSIAVLPFTNLSEDKANAYFVLGMRDEIVTSLAQLRDLDVRSRTSAEKYRSHPEDVRTIGRDLGVATVLEGSVQKAGDDVLINVQLIDAQSRDQLWAQSYRRNVKDVFSVQGEVAQQVADALKIKLAPAQTQRLLLPATTNARAHDLYLRAHALGAHADEQSLLGKIALLKKAVTEDPHYAIAWGDLAGAYLTIADAYRAPLEVLGPMRQAALMSVKNDDGAGVGHIWMGAVAMLYDRNFPLAKSELERAVALDPNSSDAHRWLGWYRARVERDFDAGLAEVQRARALDPGYTWPIMFQSLIEIARGDYPPALQLAEQVMEIDPHFFYDVDPIANAYAATGAGRRRLIVMKHCPPGRCGGRISSSPSATRTSARAIARGGS